MKVVVTGSSGRVGRYVMSDLLGAGYDVTATDTRPPAERACRFVAADLCDLGQAVGVLSGHDAVVYLAATPSPGGQPDEVVFETTPWPASTGSAPASICPAWSSAWRRRHCAGRS